MSSKSILQSKLIIIEFNKQKLALSVDDLKGIRALKEDEIFNQRALKEDDDSDYFFSGALIDNVGKIILILNVNHLVKQYLLEVELPQQDSQIVFFNQSSQYIKAMKKLSHKESIKEQDLLLFKIEKVFYTFPSISIIQLLKSLNITPAANSAPYILGSSSFRDEVIPVIDLHCFFYKEDSERSDHSPSHDYTYIAAESDGNKVFYKVQNILGNIGSPDASTITNFPNFQSSIDKRYFDGGFIRDGKIIIQLDQESILAKIKEELTEYQSKFVRENEILLSPVALPEELEALNINLQEKLNTISPTYSRLQTRKQESRRINVGKKTGILVSAGSHEIIIQNDQILEIFNVSSVTNVPNASSAVLGAINFRGEVISVLDLSEILGIYESEESVNLQAKDKILIFEAKEQIFALYVGEIKGIVDINESIIHPTVSNESAELDGYYFKGVLINSSGKIIPVLDINYLFQRSLKNEFSQKSDQLIFFKNPKSKEIVKTQKIERSGLIFTVNEENYFIPSNNVAQIIEPSSFIVKNYNHDILVGAAIHEDVVPLIDLNSLINNSSKSKAISNSANGILIFDTEIGSQMTILVDNISERVSINVFEAYKDSHGLSKEIISPLISGFFSYSGKMGIELNPKALIEECSDFIKQELSLEDIGEDFKSTLTVKEKEYLDSTQESRKKLELLLFYKQKGHRSELFTFSYDQIFLSLDVSFVDRVFSKSEGIIISSDPELSPFIGILDMNGEKYPILDLPALLLNSPEKKDYSKNSLFFQLTCENNKFIIPVDNIEGIVSKFDEELVINEDENLFSQGNEVCKNTFEHEKISSKVYIIENEYLNKILVQKRLIMNLKTLLN